MGNSNSRPRICQVIPSQSVLEDHATLPNIVTTVSFPAQQQVTLKHQVINQLPPLKQNVHSIVQPLPDLQKLHAKSGDSIIKSHPPQKAKAWQPVAPFMDLALAPDEHASMGWRDGMVNQFSSPNQERQCGASSCQQRNLEGFLQAQTLLTSQVTKKRRAHQKQFRKKQREERTLYTSTVEETDNDRPARIRLVSRPTQKDIFWDETNCQSLDLRELLQPSPSPTHSDFQMEQMMQQPQPDNRSKSNMSRFFRNQTGTVTKFDGGHISHTAQMTPQKQFPWLEDLRKQEKRYPNSLDILNGQWGHLQGSVTTRGRCSEGWRKKDISTDDHQNNWEKNTDKLDTSVRLERGHFKSAFIQENL